jgi:7,8-dihydropterin-6-yl-methyl-4-(beta-D-ribofuranosyl)aminobenzene 5'-phosphate synthase
MSRLRVTVLVDNATLIDRYFAAEPGFSAYIECDNKKILFDLGYSDLFLINAIKMGIDPLQIDYVAFSHGHLDHTGGLIPLMRRHLEARIEQLPFTVPTVVAHPHCFLPRPTPTLADIGSIIDEAQVKRQFPTTISTSPVWLTDDLVFLGEIPRDPTLADPKPRTVLTPEGLVPDLLPDDTALAYRSDEGLVIITGCSHSGICAIVEQARNICGVESIRDVIGGFHLMGNDPGRTERTVQELARFQPEALHPCHCTSLAAKIALAGVMPVHEVGVGFRLEF